MLEILATDGAPSTHRRPLSYYQGLEKRQTEAAIQRPRTGLVGQAIVYLHALAREQVHRQRVLRQHRPDLTLTGNHSLDFIYPTLQEQDIPVSLDEPVPATSPELNEAA